MVATEKSLWVQPRLHCLGVNELLGRAPRSMEYGSLNPSELDLMDPESMEPSIIGLIDSSDLR